MGHGEDQTKRKSPQHAPCRGAGEGKCRREVGYNIFLLLWNLGDLFVYVLFTHDQVNSTGYKVCGEASSVCGTITINKRKVKKSYIKVCINLVEM